MGDTYLDTRKKNARISRHAEKKEKQKVDSNRPETKQEKNALLRNQFGSFARKGAGTS